MVGTKPPGGASASDRRNPSARGGTRETPPRAEGKLVVWAIRFGSVESWNCETESQNCRALLCAEPRRSACSPLDPSRAHFSASVARLRPSGRAVIHAATMSPKYFRYRQKISVLNIRFFSKDLPMGCVKSAKISAASSFRAVPRFFAASPELFNNSAKTPPPRELSVPFLVRFLHLVRRPTILPDNGFTQIARADATRAQERPKGLS